MPETQRPSETECPRPGGSAPGARRWYRGPLAGLVTLAATAAALTAFQAPAQAAWVGEKNLRNRSTGLCLEADANHEVFMRKCASGRTLQLWVGEYVKKDNHEVVVIRNKANGWCLEKFNDTDVRLLSEVNCKADQVAFRAIGTSWDNVMLQHYDHFKNLPANFGCLDSSKDPAGVSGDSYLGTCYAGDRSLHWQFVKA
ncbi:hypothetical protein [Dactylosporangium sp. CA-233914]|uniref:hypothetical protein n=1 Tax=Dactylosporangium sp. CA-233914 TaxID=3239934 RepID=UPI003D8C0E58